MAGGMVLGAGRKMCLGSGVWSGEREAKLLLGEGMSGRGWLEEGTGRSSTQPAMASAVASGQQAGRVASGCLGEGENQVRQGKVELGNVCYTRGRFIWPEDGRRSSRISTTASMAWQAASLRRRVSSLGSARRERVHANQGRAGGFVLGRGQVAC